MSPEDREDAAIIVWPLCSLDCSPPYRPGKTERLGEKATPGAGERGNHSHQKRKAKARPIDGDNGIAACTDRHDRVESFLFFYSYLPACLTVPCVYI